MNNYPIRILNTTTQKWVKSQEGNLVTFTNNKKKAISFEDEDDADSLCESLNSVSSDLFELDYTSRYTVEKRKEIYLEIAEVFANGIANDSLAQCKDIRGGGFVCLFLLLEYGHLKYFPEFRLFEPLSKDKSFLKSSQGGWWDSKTIEGFKERLTALNLCIVMCK